MPHIYHSQAVIHLILKDEYDRATAISKESSRLKPSTIAAIDVELADSTERVGQVVRYDVVDHFPLAPRSCFKINSP